MLRIGIYSARVVKLVYTQCSERCIERFGGSSPLSGKFVAKFAVFKYNMPVSLRFWADGGIGRHATLRWLCPLFSGMEVQVLFCPY